MYVEILTSYPRTPVARLQSRQSHTHKFTHKHSLTHSHTQTHTQTHTHTRTHTHSHTRTHGRLSHFYKTRDLCKFKQMDGLREGRLDRRMDKCMDRWENGRTSRLNFLYSRCQQKFEVDNQKRLERKGIFFIFGEKHL